MAGPMGSPVAGPAGTVAQAGESFPCRQSLGQPRRAELPFGLWAVGLQSSRCPLLLGPSTSPSASCFVVKPVWVSQAANGHLAPWVSALPRVQSQRHGDPLIQWLGVPQGFPDGPDHTKAALCPSPLSLVPRAPWLRTLAMRAERCPARGTWCPPLPWPCHFPGEQQGSAAL